MHPYRRPFARTNDNNYQDFMQKKRGREIYKNIVLDKAASNKNIVTILNNDIIRYLNYDTYFALAKALNKNKSTISDPVSILDGEQSVVNENTGATFINKNKERFTFPVRISTDCPACVDSGVTGLGNEKGEGEEGKEEGKEEERMLVYDPEDCLVKTTMKCRSLFYK